jgi:Fe-S-cluster containining protein
VEGSSPKLFTGYADGQEPFSEDMDREKTVQEFVGRVQDLFNRMERSYDEVAAHYGFGCHGCDDNCCTQRFHHHTYAEYLLLLEGMKRAEPGHAKRIMERAREVTAAYAEEGEDEVRALTCPVNEDGLCTLYAYRPMICRMHGLPHRFTRPDGSEVLGGGCHRFEADHRRDRLVDRTWAYTELAHLERELRVKLKVFDRVKMTTAELLVAMVGREDALRHLEQ